MTGKTAAPSPLQVLKRSKQQIFSKVTDNLEKKKYMNIQILRFFLKQIHVVRPFTIIFNDNLNAVKYCVIKWLPIFQESAMTGKLKRNLGTVPLDRALLQLNENLQNSNSSIKEIMSQNREIKNVLVENSSLEKNKSSSSKSSDDNSDFEDQNFVGNDSITSNKDFTNSLRGLITKRFKDDLITLICIISRIRLVPQFRLCYFHCSSLIYLSIFAQLATIDGFRILPWLSCKTLSGIGQKSKGQGRLWTQKIELVEIKSSI
ncbi:hypothetical protein BpHYR1_038608 [Brachionus plicatilis]|uniref:Uncharacterized protein n=1 Tax=Brachionus plicatilis TaxID=10195 RepID=A0A3M7RL27_BRAPC|nr:hypothetical protein BpHYR1_038608 [Brachionus plicatilis]